MKPEVNPPSRSEVPDESSGEANVTGTPLPGTNPLMSSVKLEPVDFQESSQVTSCFQRLSGDRVTNVDNDGH